ncbi:MAG TPA: DNA adenine methylase [Candidatus Babeliaceae bacterium]|nr:DNA adenine methylase [Candidatus Babeliaceae bacterium]
MTKTPLRYPGGKQRLAPFVTEILVANDLIGAHYVEPYAGGAGAALELLITKKVSSIHLNDSSRAVYAFWYSVLNHSEEMCRLITAASLTIEEWRIHKNVVDQPNKHRLLDLGFSTFYLNRCNRSGILSAGVIGGLNQTGNYKMDARFSRTNLIEKIENIAIRKKNISISNLDAEAFINRYNPNFDDKTFMYLDPPYYIKGNDLYLNFYKPEDHARLSDMIQTGINCKWILSYDAADEVLALYQQRNHFVYDLQYNASRVYKGREVFIFSDDLVIPHTSKTEYINSALSEYHFYI